MSTSVRTSPENVTSRFGNHISTLPSRSAYRTVYKLFWKEIGMRALALKKKVVKCSRGPYNCKTDRFTSWIGQEWLRNAQKEKRLRQACKSSGFFFFIVKYAILRCSVPSLWWLIKLPIIEL